MAKWTGPKRVESGPPLSLLKVDRISQCSREAAFNSEGIFSREDIFANSPFVSDGQQGTGLIRKWGAWVIITSYMYDNYKER